MRAVTLATQPGTASTDESAANLRTASLTMSKFFFRRLKSKTSLILMLLLALFVLDPCQTGYTQPLSERPCCAELLDAQPLVN
jgi:hypothetical protein